MSNAHNSYDSHDPRENDGGHKQHGSIGEKLKHPFQELREKLKNTQLHDAKVHLIHQKYVHLTFNYICRYLYH